MSFKFFQILISESIFNTEGPVNLINCKNNLTWPFINPFLHFSFRIVNICFFCLCTKCLLHDFFNFKHPDFYISLFVTFINVNLSYQSNYFLLSRYHCVNFLTVTELNLLYAFEAFVHMRLYSSWVFRLGKQHQEIF